jgi:hypothetical protein
MGCFFGGACAKRSLDLRRELQQNPGNPDEAGGHHYSFGLFTMDNGLPGDQKADHVPWQNKTGLEQGLPGVPGSPVPEMGVELQENQNTGNYEAACETPKQEPCHFEIAKGNKAVPSTNKEPKVSWGCPNEKGKECMVYYIERPGGLDYIDSNPLCTGK